VRIEGGVVRNSGDGPNTVEGVYVSTRGTSLAEGLHPSNNVSIRNLRIYDDRATPYQFYGLRENCTNGIYAMDSNSFVNNDLRGNQRPLTIQVNGGGIPGCPNTLANGNILNGDITPRPWLTTQTPIATAPTRVLLRSGIDGPDATIKKMELLRNGQILTSRTSAPWLFSVTAPTSGVVAYQVRATDYMGYTSTSNALRISTSPLPANKAPTISLTSSATTATTPANLTFTANPSDVDGRIVRVELYRNGTFLASRTSAPWQFSFNNLALSGTNNFVARAIDDDSAVSVSPTVSVVLGSPYRFEARPSSFVDSTWVRYQLPSNWAAVPVHLVLRRVGSATPIQTTLDVQAKPGDNSRYWRAPKTMARGYYYLTLMMDGVAKASILLVRL
jgi:hypothetical protein